MKHSQLNIGLGKQRVSLCSVDKRHGVDIGRHVFVSSDRLTTIRLTVQVLRNTSEKATAGISLDPSSFSPEVKRSVRTLMP